ncbi:hypothetical protein A4H97_21850 [Niastella yeongjuensis]|uniref:DUF3822 domain-containing protein n=1 Tax=Niastella yeongjuensis TaxID=354355 RepID=A0A1V9F8M1_9BACT|nr:DUF3822 family protein [Niastella yeongjuensis]OQP54612.1 hypothetical protein A4H97_21850 [Niastella yeongjuensis]SEO00859.1 Protein of unknown function [Niastella yeongjuensis]
MLKANFDIVPEMRDSEELRNSQLLIEVGEKMFSFVIYNKEQKRFVGLRQYNLDYTPGKTMLENLLEIVTNDEWLQSQFKEAFIIYNYTDSNFLPEKVFHIELNQPVTEILYGNAKKGLLLSEKVIGYKMYNIYRVPREIHALLQRKFSSGNYWHYYTLLLYDQQVQPSAGEQVIKMVMRADQFLVAVFNGEKIQLIQSYTYQTPDDVSYYLLGICNKFNISQDKVTLIVSGLLDEQSRLYQELLKYFLQVQWDRMPESIKLDKAFSAFPTHYFSPLLKMALCV